MWLINEKKKPVSTDGNRKTHREEAKLSNPEMDYYAFSLISAWSNVPQFKLEGDSSFC